MKKRKAEIDRMLRRLEAARNFQKQTRKIIEELRKALLDVGINPDPPRFNFARRDRRIYNSWKKGQSFTKVAQKFGLSPTRISSICKRIECRVQRDAKKE